MESVFKRKTFQDMLLSQELERNTKNRLKEMSMAYRKIGSAMEELPMIGTKLGRDEFTKILGKCCTNLCYRCQRYRTCYEEEKTDTCKQVYRFLQLYQESGKELQLWEDTYFKKCIQKQKFLYELIKNYEVMCVHFMWLQKSMEERKVVASQMHYISSILHDFSTVFYNPLQERTKLERMLCRKLKREGISIGAIRVMENGKRRKEIYFIARARDGNRSVYELADMIGQMIRRKLCPADDCRLVVRKEPLFFHLIEEPFYHITMQSFYVPAAENTVSGDQFSVFELKKTKKILLLLDGMGRGEEAEKESRKTLELLEEMLESGMHEEEALRLLNGTLTIDLERSRFSTIDLISIDLFSGIAKIIKMGSADTYIKRGKHIEVIRGNSLPAGFLSQVEFDAVYKKLYDGDVILMFSDGILEREEKEEEKESLKDFVSRLSTQNPDKIMEYIKKMWIDSKNNQDDVTLLVAGIEKKY